MAAIILAIVACYAGCGALFAAAFVWRGVQRLDPAADGAGWSFRVLMIPGSAALWPILAWRWRRLARRRSSA